MVHPELLIFYESSWSLYPSFGNRTETDVGLRYFSWEEEVRLRLNTASLGSWSKRVKMCYFPCLQVCEMAADISESGGHDCKGEPRGNTK